MIKIQTNQGDITLELFEDKAPETCKNFLEYANSGFYDGTIFHRVIKGFMIQGGGFMPGMRQKPASAPIKNEADNGIGNTTGSIAMARTSDPHSATAQFFINVNDNDFLNFRAPTASGWGYCVFGRVIEGMDTVRAIEKAGTGSRAGHQDVPNDDVVIQSVTVI